MDGPFEHDQDVDARGFSVRMGYYLAQASEAAYEEDCEWIERFRPKHRITFFECDDFRGLVGFQEKFTVLAFRGTQSMGNFLTDADTLFVSQFPYPGRVHSGFSQAVEDVWPDVRRILGNPSRSKPIWVTGHSLGGAMATLASVRLASEGYTVRAIYTYGSPRVGDRQFRDSYHLANYRFVNDNDLVPHLPFRWCYKHVGKVRLLNINGDYTEEQTAWVAKKRALAKHAKKVHRAHRHSHHHSTGILHALSDWLVDHYINCYLDAIKKILPRKLNAMRLAQTGIDLRHALLPLHQQKSAMSKDSKSMEDRIAQKPAISDADFIASFCNQPLRKTGT